MPRALKNQQYEPATNAPLELGVFVCFAIYSDGHAFNRVYQPLLKQFELTYPQFIAMVVLWGQDGQTVGELGEKLFLQSHTLTPMLKRLEALGYIKRSRDSADERQVRIHLTETGRKLHLQASDVVRSVRDATGLQDRQMKDLVRDVDALRRKLEGHLARRLGAAGQQD